jgi:hypothetical protein
MFNTVHEFVKFWMSAGRPILPPFDGPVFTTDIAYSLVLYRKDNCQVELYTCKPNTEAPWHSHPGVDSFFVYLGGNIDFGQPNGEFAGTAQYQQPRQDGAHLLFGQTSEALDGARHTLRVGPEGGAFLSFEKWDKKIPTSVTVNWTGDPVGQEHKSALEILNAGT